MDREQILNQLALLGSRPVKTPLGSLLEYVGLPRQRLENVLAKPFFQIGPQRPGQQESLNALARDITSAMPYQVVPRDMPLNFLGQIKAYHGTPYKFEKFKNEAIGSGEGAQAFGWGHYLTESPEVAGSYAKVRSGQSSEYGWRVGQKVVLEAETEFPAVLNNYAHGIPREKILRNIDDRIRSLSKIKNQEGAMEALEHARRSKKFAESIDEKVSFWEGEGLSPRVYEAAIHKGKQPGEYTYLRWDENISPDTAIKIKNQAEKEGINLRDLFTRRGYNINDPQGLGYAFGKGEGLYRTLSAKFANLRESGMSDKQKLGSALNLGEREASAFLKRAGIDGIKYPSGSLSGVKSDKYNYVVFDPGDITIEGTR